jgi:hypothetical protein
VNDRSAVESFRGASIAGHLQEQLKIHRFLKIKFLHNYELEIRIFKRNVKSRIFCFHSDSMVRGRV